MHTTHRSSSRPSTWIAVAETEFKLMHSYWILRRIQIGDWRWPSGLAQWSSSWLCKRRRRNHRKQQCNYNFLLSSKFSDWATGNSCIHIKEQLAAFTSHNDHEPWGVTQNRANFIFPINQIRGRTGLTSSPGRFSVLRAFVREPVLARRETEFCTKRFEATLPNSPSETFWFRHTSSAENPRRTCWPTSRNHCQG